MPCSISCAFTAAVRIPHCQQAELTAAAAWVGSPAVLDEWAAAVLRSEGSWHLQILRTRMSAAGWF